MSSAACYTACQLLSTNEIHSLFVKAKLAACRANKEADKAAAAAAKEERLRVMQERLAAWQASQAK